MEKVLGPASAARLDLGAKLVILLGGMLAALALTAINSVLPLIDADLARTPSDSMMVKQLIGGVGLAMVVGAAISGFLVDRLGLRRVMIFASLVYVIAGTAGLYLNSLPLLLASRLLLGLAAACIQIASLTLINTRLEGHDRARWMGIHISAAMFGTIAFHPIAGNLGELSWRYPFGLYALGLVLIAGMLFGRPDEQVRAPRIVAKATPSRTLVERMKGMGWFPFHYLPLAVLTGSTVFLPMIYLPYLLKDLGASPSIIAYVLTADSLAGAGVALFYGRARRYLSTHRAFMISFSAVAAGNFIAVVSPSLVGVIAGMVVYGFGTGWLMSNLLTSLGEKVRKDRQGRSTGFVKAAHFLSAPLAVAVMEPFANHYGPRSALLAVAAIAAALIVLIGIRAFWLRQGAASRARLEELA